VRRNVVQKKLLLLFVFAVILSLTLAAKDRTQIFIEKGNEAYNEDRYEVALRFYEKAIDAGCEDAIIWYRRAYSIEQTEGFRDAENHYWGALFRLRDQQRDHRYFDYAKSKVLRSDNPDALNLLHSTYLQLWDEAEKFLQTAEDIDEDYHSGATPLFWSVYHKNEEFAMELLSRGADPSARVKENNLYGKDWYYVLSPFGMAVINGLENVVEISLENGADPNTDVRWGDQSGSLLTFAIQNGRKEVTYTLLEYGADPDYRNFKPLFTAIEKGQNETIEQLLDFGAEPNARREKSALLTTILTGNNEALELLLEYGATPEVHTKGFHKKTFYYASPMMAAIHTHNLEAVNLLAEFGADFETPVFGQDALTHVAAYGTPEILDSLLEHGVEQHEIGQHQTEDFFLYCPDYPLDPEEASYKVLESHTSYSKGRTFGDEIRLKNPSLVTAAVTGCNLDTLQYLVETRNRTIPEKVNNHAYGREEEKSILELLDGKIATLDWIIHDGFMYMYSVETGDEFDPEEDVEKLSESDRREYEKYMSDMEKFTSMKTYVEKQLGS
jgi:ankyrin repeat protein